MDTLLWIGIAAIIVGAIALSVNYDIERYHRKFPGTTTLDYWMDGRK
jgi:hypothetical protein